MKKIFLLTLSLLFLSACSFKSPPNKWQYQASANFDAYIDDFLSSNDTMARNDLKRAIYHAKKSADLTTLAQIYLGKCALNISVGIDDKCLEYKNISHMLNNNTLDAYFNLITLNIDKLKVENLDNNYKNFAHNIQKKEFNKAIEDINNITKPTSKLLCASLITKHLDSNTRTNMINISSFHGYKKSVLFWLKEQKKYTTNKKENNIISKRIFIIDED